MTQPFTERKNLTVFAIDYTNNRVSELGLNPITRFDEISRLELDASTRPIVLELQTAMKQVLRQQRIDRPH